MVPGDEAAVFPPPPPDCPDVPPTPPLAVVDMSEADSEFRIREICFGCAEIVNNHLTSGELLSNEWRAVAFVSSYLWPHEANSSLIEGGEHEGVNWAWARRYACNDVGWRQAQRITQIIFIFTCKNACLEVSRWAVWQTLALAQRCHPIECYGRIDGLETSWLA